MADGPVGEAEFARLRDEAATELERREAVPRDWMRRAVRAVPRERFVPGRVWLEDGEDYRSFRREDDERRWAQLVYRVDAPVVTQVDDGEADGHRGAVPTSSISAMTAVMTMLAEAEPEPDQRVLEIGAGTGYNAALLAERVGARGRVVSVEVDPVVCAQARQALETAGYDTVRVVEADGEAGWAGEAPYDRVLSTAAVTTVPYAWVAQTRPRGIIVSPWRTRFYNHGLVRLVVAEDGTASGHFVGAVSFMLMRGQRRTSGIETLFTPAGWDEARTQPLDLASLLTRLENPHARFATGLYLPDVAHWPQDGGHWWCGAGSWAYADGRIAYQWGPHDLIEETSQALDTWHAADEPTLFDYGLSVTPAGSATWLHHSGNPVIARTPPA
ncbi:methyltransferase domain-containing protein [Streptomyces lichenis]|uniref:Protein-L-isoaspartate O-methyltransferase n=1 Tax=Streptomyces lichenis TaxID=2306967 RepID=A0ABT0ID48_9ACTN|nr:methyltransferase domain-containing protein [Streptomyces lichenis]MCK8679210.1 methyltransferase domain-containing protein [Streptomyces lichenis]